MSFRTWKVSPVRPSEKRLRGAAALATWIAKDPFGATGTFDDARPAPEPNRRAGGPLLVPQCGDPRIDTPTLVGETLVGHLGELLEHSRATVGEKVDFVLDLGKLAHWGGWFPFPAGPNTGWHTAGVRISRRAALLVAAAALVALPAAAQAARTPAQRQMAAVVRQWSDRLNAGDNAGIARLFAVPALIVQGPYAYKLVSRKEVARWFSLLPCSGHVTRIVFAGRFATAVFRLGNRGASPCDAPGGLAAARFEIVHGKIASWVQVAVPPKTASGPVA
jgi:hypothetical protein